MCLWLLDEDIDNIGEELTGAYEEIVSQKERDTLAEKHSGNRKSISTATVDLAKMEVLDHNRRDLERMLENESHQHVKEINRERKWSIER